MALSHWLFSATLSGTGILSLVLPGPVLQVRMLFKFAETPLHQRQSREPSRVSDPTQAAANPECGSNLTLRRDSQALSQLATRTRSSFRRRHSPRIGFPSSSLHESGSSYSTRYFTLLLPLPLRRLLRQHTALHRQDPASIAPCKTTRAGTYFLLRPISMTTASNHCLEAATSISVPDTTQPMRTLQDQTPSPHGRGLCPGCLCVHQISQRMFLPLSEFTVQHEKQCSTTEGIATQRR